MSTYDYITEQRELEVKAEKGENGDSVSPIPASKNHYKVSIFTKISLNSYQALFFVTLYLCLINACFILFVLLYAIYCMFLFVLHCLLPCIVCYYCILSVTLCWILLYDMRSV